MKNVIERTVEFVQKHLADEKSGHDWQHVQRVWKTAVYLQSKEGGNLEVIELAALLHTAAERDYKNPPDEKIRPLALSGIFDVLEIAEDLKPLIISIIQASKFHGAESKIPMTLEAKIVQDANWLDSLGAIGIARNFTAGGYIGRKIFNPRVKLGSGLSRKKLQKKKKESSSIAYFYEKAFVIPSLLSTNTAKHIAAKRVDFIKQFVAQFMQEWDMLDL
jgi:uncharacterized protein